MSSEAAIEVEGIVKRYGDVRALDGVDLVASPGKVLGLLGPNGAGKTTLVRVLATLIEPDAGTARVTGLDVVARCGARARADRAGRAVRGGRRKPDGAGEPHDGRPALRLRARARQAPRRASCSSASI